jgi:hypothetical protein
VKVEVGPAPAGSTLELGFLPEKKAVELAMLDYMDRHVAGWSAHGWGSFPAVEGNTLEERRAASAKMYRERLERDVGEYVERVRWSR